MTLGELIRQYREQCAMPVQALAKATGLREEMLLDIEEGRMPDPPEEVLLAISGELGCPPWFLMSLRPVAAASDASEQSVVFRCGMIAAEAAGSSGWEWDVDLVTAGVSLTGWLWRPDVLKEAIPLFEGARAYAHNDGPHTDPNYRRVQDIVGWYSDVRFVEDRLRARLHITQNAQWLRDLLVSAAEKGKRDIVEFSIHVLTMGSMRMMDGQLLRVPDKIVKVFSADVVSEGAAGGHLVEMAASLTHQKEDLHMLQQLLERLKARRPDLYATLDLQNVTESQVITLLAQAMESAPKPASAAAQPTTQEAVTEDPTVTQATQAASTAAQHADRAQAALVEMEVRQSRTFLEAALSNSNLPVPAQTMLRKRFGVDLDAGRPVPTQIIEDAVRDHREMLSQVMQTAPLSMPRAEVGQEAREKALNGMMGLLTGKPENGVKPFMSLKHAFYEMTGQAMATPEAILAEARFFVPWDAAVNPALRQRYMMSMQSLKTSDFGEILGDSVARVMIRMYNLPDLNVWRRIVSDITPIMDFRTQHRPRMGGYGTLPTVAERGTYAQLTSPSDEEETFSISKKGGLEDLTIEMIANDDIRSLRNIPLKLGRAAAQTLYRGVFDIFTTNANMADGVAMFHATHGNLGSTALNNTSMSAARQAMMDQAAYGDSSEVLGLANVPRFLLHPNELEETAWQLSRGWDQGQGEHDQTDRNANFHAGRVESIPVAYWTDANDHYYTADPSLAPTVEVGVYQGREDPELFVQDNPTLGSVFTSDRITYKIRHIWSTKALDHRSFYAQKPA